MDTYAAVSQVETEQIRVISMWFRKAGAVGASGTRGAVRRLFRVRAPIAQRRPIHSGRQADAAETNSAFHEGDRMAAHLGAVHNGSVSGGTDKTERDISCNTAVPRVGFEPTLHGV